MSTLKIKKGDTVIRKAGRQESRKQDYMIRAYLADRRESRRNLRAFRKAAAAAGRGNVALSGAAGVGMGLFGVALPDIPLFTGLLLKSIYETAVRDKTAANDAFIGFYL